MTTFFRSYVPSLLTGFFVACLGLAQVLPTQPDEAASRGAHRGRRRWRDQEVSARPRESRFSNSPTRTRAVG